MFPTCFKNGKSVRIADMLHNYLIDNFTCCPTHELNSDSEKLQLLVSFFNEFEQKRNAVLNLNDINKGYNDLKEAKNSIIEYIQILNAVKDRICFSNEEEYSVKIEFSWTDTLQQKIWNSYSINVEYYSNLFNLGVIYYTMGSVLSSHVGDDVEASLAKSCELFQYGGGIFDLIKNEAPGLLLPNEIPPDLSFTYLTYCSYLCLAHGQCGIVTISDFKSKTFDIQAKLAESARYFFHSAYKFAKEPLSKYSSDSINAYLINRECYYHGLAYLKMKEMTMLEDDKNEEKYDIACAYQYYGVDILTKGMKDITKCANLVNVSEYEENLKGQITIRNAMCEGCKCQRSLPCIADLPKVEKLITIKLTVPVDIHIKCQESSVLDILFPEEMTQLFEAYKSQISRIIMDKLNQFSDTQMKNFLYNLNTISNVPQTEISESMWKRIKEIQQMGGMLYLNNRLSLLQSQSGDIEKSIMELLLTLSKDEEEDSLLQNKFGKQWKRSTLTVSKQYIGKINSYHQQLDNRRKYDIKTKETILKNKEAFKLLLFERDDLLSKFLKRSNGFTKMSSNENLSLKKDLESIENCVDQALEKIKYLFLELTSENPSKFLMVIQKKATEDEIFEVNKTKYEGRLLELSEITQKLNNMKIEIEKKNESYLKMKADLLKKESIAFLNQLDCIVKLFHTQISNIEEGLQFYSKLSDKVCKLNATIKDYIVARDLEKNDMLNLLATIIKK